MYTYILKSNEFYKIGVTHNFKQRLNQHRGSNPHIQPVAVYLGEYERELLKIFKKNIRHGKEWLSITSTDIQNIDTLITSKPSTKDKNSILNEWLIAGNINEEQKNIIESDEFFKKAESYYWIKNGTFISSDIKSNLLKFVHNVLLFSIEESKYSEIENAVLKTIKIEFLDVIIPFQANGQNLMLETKVTTYD